MANIFFVREMKMAAAKRGQHEVRRDQGHGTVYMWTRMMVEAPWKGAGGAVKAGWVQLPGS